MAINKNSRKRKKKAKGALAEATGLLEIIATMRGDFESQPGSSVSIAMADAAMEERERLKEQAARQEPTFTETADENVTAAFDPIEGFDRNEFVGKVESVRDELTPRLIDLMARHAGVLAAIDAAKTKTAYALNSSADSLSDSAIRRHVDRLFDMAYFKLILGQATLAPEEATQIVSAVVQRFGPEPPKPAAAQTQVDLSAKSAKRIAEAVGTTQGRSTYQRPEQTAQEGPETPPRGLVSSRSAGYGPFGAL